MRRQRSWRRFGRSATAARSIHRCPRHARIARGDRQTSRDHFGSPIEAERVVVTTGASAALVLACAALIDPGDEVLVADPSYPCNRSFASAFGADVRLLPTGPERRFQLDAQLVADAWTERTCGVMIASPSNPTGTSMSHDELVATVRDVEARWLANRRRDSSGAR